MHKVLKVSLVLVVMIALGVYALNSVVNGSGETPAEIKERFQKIWDEIYLKGNLDALDQVYGPDVIRHTINRPDIIGLDAYKALIKSHRALFPECRVILDEVFIAGDRLITTWTFQGTYAAQRTAKWIFQNKETGESETIGVSIPAGRTYTSKGCTIAKIVNSMFVEEWLYTDDIVPALIAGGMELAKQSLEE